MIRAIESKKKIVSEINITPLVDTLLVLLIIFMVTAPAMTRSVGIELPKPKHGAAAESVSQEKKNFAVIGINTKKQFIFKKKNILQKIFFKNFRCLLKVLNRKRYFSMQTNR